MQNNTLFPNADQRDHWDEYLTTRLSAAMADLPNGPVAPDADPAILRAELATFDFETPIPMDHLLDWTVETLSHGIVQLNHPRYLGLFNPKPSFPAQLAERITAAFNPQLASATTSPAATAIEAHVCTALARRAGLGAAATGHFTSGGSEANYTAVICALTAAHPGFAAQGARAFPGQPVFYISADSHLAWIKIAHQAGIGRNGARMVATDGAGRICPDALRTAIAADRAQGHVPFMIAATAGTTNAGMIDPLVPCADIARAQGLWFHVDAAWGGALLCSATHRVRLAGIERADSITIDAHKWFATTMGCGMFLTAHQAALSAAFTVTASFMPSHAPAQDPYVTTAQWSRRFLGLRLFLSLASGGWAAHARHVETAIGLATSLRTRLIQSGWTAQNGADSLAVICLTPPPGAPSVRDIAHTIVTSGAAWVSTARFEGQDVLRACVTNGETTEADIHAVADALAALCHHPVLTAAQ
ncbi:MAG: pyridoxal-dependent decarboxylase [Acidocella sp.]|nr:pyridoxal-dependent decarboxylase [Acidocella sp.]